MWWRLELGLQQSLMYMSKEKAYPLHLLLWIEGHQLLLYSPLLFSASDPLKSLMIEFWFQISAILHCNSQFWFKVLFVPVSIATTEPLSSSAIYIACPINSYGNLIQFITDNNFIFRHWKWIKFNIVISMFLKVCMKT